MENKCICCDEIIPEGGQVCIDCENQEKLINKMANDLKSIFKTGAYNYKYIAIKLLEKGWKL